MAETTSTMVRLDFMMLRLTDFLQDLEWLRNADGVKEEVNISKTYASSFGLIY